MDITTILNSKGSAAAAAAAAAAANQDHHFHQQLQQAARANGLVSSETGSDRDGSPHPSEQSRYSSRSTQPPHTMMHMPNDMRYPSPTTMQAPMQMMQPGYVPGALNDDGYPRPGLVPLRSSGGEIPQKAFPCQTCGKGFARRSDLARHERIHSGIRPHVCDVPGCGKQFIQRSALTVHARVHTGEKPHMCERCGKPFSDSSSLARHRRIHSGKRPYKCPYADCQKTFTRRTTLTRHQNQHTGTVEEAAAATAAALASRPASGRGGRPRSEGESYSNADSPISTPSPHQRPLSLSPSAEHPPLPSLQRQATEYSFMSNGSLPPHIRGELPQHNARPSPTDMPGTIPRVPQLTSHPAGYGPPPTLEPSPTGDQRSNHGSPHMSNSGWQSPSHAGLPSPGPDGYAYPDPHYSAAGPQLYYPNSNIRRPQSGEPDGYDAKSRVGNEAWPTQVT